MHVKDPGRIKCSTSASTVVASYHIFLEWEDNDVIGVDENADDKLAGR